MTEAAAATVSEIGDNNGRQPDYYIGRSGIPRLVGGSRLGSAVEQQRTTRRKRGTMSNQRGGPSGGNSVVGTTDPVKLNKCLYNLTVRNRNGSNRTESDSPSPSHKSKSPTTGSDSDNNGNNYSIWRGSMCSATSTVITTGLCNSRRNSVTSSRGSSSSSSSAIPRSSSAHWTHLGGRNAVSRHNGVSSEGRSPPPHSTTMLLSDRQRRNATATGGDSNRRIDRGECESSSLMRQCRFTVAVRRPPPPTSAAASADNRLSYQRKYDRSIFGYNRLDQIVLPPLQI